MPEGGGALIEFNNGKTSQNSYYSNVYGWDMGQDRDAVVHDTRTYFNVLASRKMIPLLSVCLKMGCRMHPFRRISVEEATVTIM